MTNEHIVKAFSDDLLNIKNSILEMGGEVEKQLHNSIESLVNNDSSSCEEIIAKDNSIDELQIRIQASVEIASKGVFIDNVEPLVLSKYLSMQYYSGLIRNSITILASLLGFFIVWKNIERIATYVLGYRIALIVAGAGALYLAEYMSWSAAFIIMSLCFLLGPSLLSVARRCARKV